MKIEEIFIDDSSVAYTKGHVNIKEFIEAVENEDFDWDEDPLEETDIYHDYARKIPGEWDGERCILTWLCQKPGRGAFPITRTDY